ncbi:hypothetical protein MGI18_15235 [Bacillus sp. OVS6]|nr:hypothetical protein MGI18_15235 [Bacillus sp. OVS6]
MQVTFSAVNDNELLSQDDLSCNVVCLDPFWLLPFSACSFFIEAANVVCIGCIKEIDSNVAVIMPADSLFSFFT